MITLPEVTAVGTLTDAPELRFTPSGTAVANFTVAANERKRNEAGEWVDGDATFLRCNIWRDYAEHVAESLEKGQRVIVQGRLKQRSFETREGEKRTVFELEVEEVGPSLKWATATVTKASRSGGGTQQSSKPKGKSDDPWGGKGAPGGKATADDDSEPPF